MATLLDGPHAGAKVYVDADSRVGALGGPPLLEANVEREARGLVVQGQSTVRSYGEDGATLGTGLRVHVAAFAEPPRMVIFGAIDFAAALAPMARGLGYRVTIADPRRAFLESPRFKAAAEVVAGWPDAVLERGHARPARRGAGLHARPEARRARRAGGARRAAPATSARSAAARRRSTATSGCGQAGVDEDDIARVFAPCGLDVGASTVEETAIAVLAEIIGHRAGREGGSLRSASGPIRRERDEASRLVP